MNTLIEWEVIFRGRVQGVGFRWTVVEHAEAVGVTGWVANHPDGSVVARMQGIESQIQECIARIQKMPGNAQITNVQSTPVPPKDVYPVFTITRV